MTYSERVIVDLLERKERLEKALARAKVAILKECECMVTNYCSAHRYLKEIEDIETGNVPVKED